MTTNPDAAAAKHQQLKQMLDQALSSAECAHAMQRNVLRRLIEGINAQHAGTGTGPALSPQNRALWDNVRVNYALCIELLLKALLSHEGCDPKKIRACSHDLCKLHELVTPASQRKIENKYTKHVLLQMEVGIPLPPADFSFLRVLDSHRLDFVNRRYTHESTTKPGGLGDISWLVEPYFRHFATLNSEWDEAIGLHVRITRPHLLGPGQDWKSCKSIWAGYQRH